MLRYLLLSFAMASVFSKTACDVLCSGPILEAVCAADPPVFNDSKTFVDLVLLKDPEIIIDGRFLELKRGRKREGVSRNLLCF